MSISCRAIRRLSRTGVSFSWLHHFDEEVDVVGQVVPCMTHAADSSIDDRTNAVPSFHSGFDTKRRTEFLQHVASRSGAVVMSRSAFDQAGGDLSGYAFQMPIFVLTRRIPIEPVNGQNDRLRVSFVGEGIECAVARARVGRCWQGRGRHRRRQDRPAAHPCRTGGRAKSGRRAGPAWTGTALLPV